MVKRPYHAPRREAQAAATRRAVIEAAHRLFVEQGYAATSIRAVADRAEVGEQTVYRLFASKAALLREVLLAAVSWTGSDATDGGADALLANVAAGPTPSDRLRRIAAWSANTFQRGAAELEGVIFTAAEIDPRLHGLAAQVRELRYGEIRALVAAVAAGQEPPRGMTIEQVADFIYAVWSPSVYRLLVEDRGWTLDQFIEWVTLMVERMFLEGPTDDRPPGDRGSGSSEPHGTQSTR